MMTLIAPPKGERLTGACVQTVILNWRTPDMTLRATEAALTAMEGVAGGITIVDNDSGDGSFETLSDTVASRGWNRVQVVQSGRNGGFGAGNNFGILTGLPDGSPADFIYVLNSDAFPAPDAIRALLRHLDSHPEAGFAGSFIHGPEGDTHLTTFRFPSLASEFETAAKLGLVTRLLRNRIVPLPTPAAAGRVDWLAGASLMMRREELERIGLFDEGFFLYFEETDLCLRLARAGREVHFVPESRVAHIGSVSTGMKEWREMPGYWYDSRWHYFRRNHGRIHAALAMLAQLSGGIVHRLRALLPGGRRADPPRFLRRLLRHDLRALIAGSAPRAIPPLVQSPVAARAVPAPPAPIAVPTSDPLPNK